MLVQYRKQNGNQKKVAALRCLRSYSGRTRPCQTYHRNFFGFHPIAMKLWEIACLTFSDTLITFDTLEEISF